MSLPPDPADEAPAAPSPPESSAAEALEPTLDAEVLPLEDLGPLANEQAGRYHLERVVGRGGQSVVHAARDTWLGRVVAYKQRLPGTAGEARFVREARLTAVLDHPGIVTVHELGRRPDGTLYATQALVRGETLGARLARAETLSERLALLRNLVDACFAVGFAHEHGVVHRDLKPDNIMVGAFGETVVLDWGIAGVRGQADVPSGAARPRGPDSLTHDGAVMGTPGYMAPEQARGDLDAIGPASDVWSLGAILYELVTGTPAVTGLDSQHKLAQSADLALVPVRVVNPDVPPDLAALTERAMAPDPADRFEDAVALAEELERWRVGDRVAGYTYGAQDLVRWAARR
ncbi:MAG: serine/threonine protein kinase, partial [Myxococcales bacterium]|nr:serine/threonine protein kinase [Myxococcales bacterium]